MNKSLWLMAIRNVGRRPRRSALSVLAIGLAAATMVCLFALVAGLKDDLRKNIQRFSTGQVLVEDARAARGTAGLAYALQDVSRWQSVLGTGPITAVSPRIVSGASVFRDGDAVFFSLMGADFGHDPLRLDEVLEPGGRVPGSGAREAVISSGLAEKLSLRVGDTLTAITQTRRGSTNGMTFTITGIARPGVATLDVPWLFTSLATAQRFVKMPDGATSLLISTTDADAKAVARAVQANLDRAGARTIIARAWSETSSTVGLLDLASVIYGFIGLFFVALASTVIINTMLMVVLERTPEIGMLSALGMDPRQLRNLFLAESAVLSGLGAGAGVIVGSVVVGFLAIFGLDYTQAMKGVSLEVSGIIRPLLDPWTPVLVFVEATVVALAFTLIPLARLKRLPIVDALRGDTSTGGL